MPLLTEEVVVLHFPSGKKTGGVAVALRREGEGARAAVALCDKGTVYSEGVGAEIATRRLETDEAVLVPGATAALAVSEMAAVDHELLAACLRENGMSVSALRVAEDTFETPTPEPELVYIPFTVQTEHGPYRDSLSMLKGAHETASPEELQRQMEHRAANWLARRAAPAVELTDAEVQERFNANVGALLDQVEAGDVSQLAEETEARVVELAAEIGRRKQVASTGIDALDVVNGFVKP